MTSLRTLHCVYNARVNDNEIDKDFAVTSQVLRTVRLRKAKFLNFAYFRFIKIRSLEQFKSKMEEYCQDLNMEMNWCEFLIEIVFQNLKNLYFLRL